MERYEALPGRYFMRDGEWIKAAPESPVGETLYRCVEQFPIATQMNVGPALDASRATHGLAGSPALVPIGWICADDLARLKSDGQATVYEEPQQFRFLTHIGQHRLFAAGVAVPLNEQEKNHG